MTTKVRTSSDPKWRQEFWVPVLLPTTGQLVTIQVRDYDTIGAHDDVDTLTMRFDKIEAKSSHSWWHLYGLSEEAEKMVSESPVGALMSSAKAILRGQSGTLSKRAELKRQKAFYSSTWRGRVLL